MYALITVKVISAHISALIFGHFNCFAIFTRLILLYLLFIALCDKSPLFIEFCSHLFTSYFDV